MYIYVYIYIHIYVYIYSYMCVPMGKPLLRTSENYAENFEYLVIS